MAIESSEAEDKTERASSADEVTLDRLAGDWWIYQLRYGHRYASDDVLTAWLGVESAPDATSILDLGAGIGSAGLLTLLRLGGAARLTSVEVQALSVELLYKTLRHNRLGDRVSIRHGDLRDESLLHGDERFDLILANPPFLPTHRASRSPHPQRAAARLELNGDVFDYCATAARRLAPDGRFCFCHRADDERPELAVERSGLFVVRRREVVFREGRPPALALFTCARSSVGARCGEPPLALRDRQGHRTDAYRSVRRAMLIEE